MQSWPPTLPDVQIVFTKLPEAQHRILVRERAGPDVATATQPTGPTIPHDLVHAAVEAALAIDDGFWAATAAGATFDGFQLIDPGRHGRSGLKVLRRTGGAVMQAELAVNWAYRVWTGRSVTGRGVGRSPLSDDNIATAVAAIEAASVQWHALDEGDDLTWVW